MIIFDYIFFRVAKFFYKKDGVDAFRAICTVSLIQTLILGKLFFWIVKLKYWRFDHFIHLPIQVKYFAYVIALIIIFFNYIRYRKKYWRFSEKWKDTETQSQRKLRGVLVVSAILLPFLLIFL